MKELTHEEWMENPTPRIMWVWDSNEANKWKMKVVYFSKQDIAYPVIVLSDNDKEIRRYKHCAEIEKARRMTNKELSRWLRLNPTRECKYLNNGRSDNANFVFCYHTYFESAADEVVGDTILIRENDGEWREPLVEDNNNDND